MGSSQTSVSSGQRATPLLAYWPAVDGLRTVAVTAVVLFHLNRSLLPGGFVGVDIFFVISGFLISAVLLSDVERHRFSVKRFYQRRIARIAPAFFLVLAVTLVAAWAIYSAQDYASASAAAAFTAASLANIKYMLMGSYFKISPDAQPLLHYWSLAVEEQFYLVFPLFLWAIVRWTRHPLTITVLVFIASLVLCCVVTVHNPVYAFYLLPTRAWELLAGVYLTLARWRGPLPPRWSGRSAWVGVILMAASFVLVREGPSFPGVIALLPVVGTALVLAAVDQPGSRLNRLLASAPMVHVGKRSYALYLWHWPIFCFVDYQWFAAPSAIRTIVKIAAVVALTWSTYVLVERPARKALNAPGRAWLAFAGFAAAMGALVLVGATNRNAYYIDAMRDSLAGGGIHAATGSGPRIAMIGDSQAAMYAARVAEFAKRRGYDLHALGQSAGNVMPGEENSSWPQVAGYLDRARPQLVIVAEAWDDKLGPDAAGLRAAVAFFHRRGALVIILAQPPQATEPSSRQGIRSGAHAPFRERRENTVRRLAALSLLRQLAGGDVQVVDAGAIMTAPDGGILLIGPNGRLTYQDQGHLSDTGVDLVMPSIRAAIARALDGAEQPER